MSKFFQKRKPLWAEDRDDPALIKLTDTECRIIWEATQHRKRITGHGLPFRVMLTRILEEYYEELKMVERDLRAEENHGKQ